MDNVYNLAHIVGLWTTMSIPDNVSPASGIIWGWTPLILKIDPDENYSGVDISCEDLRTDSESKKGKHKPNYD